MPGTTTPQHTRGLRAPDPSWVCRWSGSPEGYVVLDLGDQPAADLFPLPNDPIPDPEHPLRMVISTASGLVQLETDPTTPEEPRGVEPAALVAQAEAAAGVLMITHRAIWLSVPIALVIGGIGAVSVFKAVYVDKRELKCACVGGNTNVPLGFVSLTENVMMVAMAVWMLVR